MSNLHGSEVAPHATPAADGGFVCRYRLNRTLKADGSLAEQLMQGTNANDPRASFMLCLLKMGEGATWVEDRFELTPSGWRSPTIRERGLDSIGAFYDGLHRGLGTDQ